MWRMQTFSRPPATLGGRTSAIHSESVSWYTFQTAWDTTSSPGAAAASADAISASGGPSMMNSNWGERGREGEEESEKGAGECTRAKQGGAGRSGANIYKGRSPCRSSLEKTLLGECEQSSDEDGWIEHRR